MADIDKIILENTGLIYKQLHRFELQNDEDAYSWALEALGNAVKTYDSSKGYAFSTYATTCIYNGIGCYLRTLNKQSRLDVLSYDEYLSDEQDSSFLQLLSHNDTPDKILIDKYRYRKIWEVFYEVLDECDGIAKAVVEYWKDSDFSAAQKEIADIFNISQPHVSRTLSAFKHNLKTRLEESLCEK